MFDDPTRDGATLDPPRPNRRRHGDGSANPLGALDELTGLRNQRALWRELSRRVALCSQRTPLAVIMVDFDAFGELNDSHGRAAADQVLQRAAAVMRSAGVSRRLAFRNGGEEFVVLAAGDKTDGRAIAEQLRAQIERQNGDLPSTTVSCGVAIMHSPVEPWVALDRADAALHEAKRAGGNRVEVAGHAPATADAYLMEALEHERPRRAALALAVANVTARTVESVDDPEDMLTLCEAIGRRMDIQGAALNRLLASAQLHDVGKVAVPPEIFNKPGPLTEDERALIGEHTVIGEGILRSVPEMDEVATIVRHSQEHWDGSGYPDGLAGEDIPLASRVILCASAFRSMRFERPYRPGRPAAEAIEELRECAGTQFDPAVVKALADVAEGVRRENADPQIVTALPRSRRLAALLLALTLSTGTAFAAIPEIRDLVRALFGISSGPSDVISPDADGRGLDLGPIPDIISLRPADRRGGAKEAESAPSIAPLGLAVKQAVRNDPEAPPADPHTVFGDGDGSDPLDGGDGLTPRPRVTKPDPQGPGGGPGPGPGAGPAPGGPAPDDAPAPGPGPGGQQPPADAGPGPTPDPGPTPGPGPGPDPDPGTPPPPTGKQPPPRNPDEPPRRDDEAKEPGSPGKPDNPGRTDPPGHAPR